MKKKLTHFSGAASAKAYKSVITVSVLKITFLFVDRCHEVDKFNVV